LFARRLNNALTQLTRGAEAIKLHNYHYHIQLDRRDELGLVAKQFNEMADVIAERIDMLKYLPKHTLEAIARRSRTGAVVETEYVKGTVVYTQLRGDLAISSELSPEEIIETLNQALQLQAEVFDRYGGVIDKLIGDGVLAVFKDFAHVHRAVEASLDIQEAVQALYQSKKHSETDEETDEESMEDDEENSHSTPIEIGIGITTGYLVFGEVGSELRKERILIGPEVNLATRLGHLASAGEVIISDQVRDNLGKAIETTKTEEVEITGFEDNQIIHSVSTIKPFAAQETWTV
jgi:class 3 adenylate cyclase